MIASREALARRGRRRLWRRGLLCGPIDEGVDCLAADGPQPGFVDASIVRYLAALDRADRDESDVAEARTTRLKDKIARLRQRMQALRAMKEKVQDAPDQQIYRYARLVKFCPLQLDSRAQ